MFLDPPYDLPDAAVLDALAALVHVAPGALLVLERSARDALPGLPEGVRLDRTRTYGDTAVHLLEVSPAAADASAEAGALGPSRARVPAQDRPLR